jgi:hypothetical protein
MDGGENDGRRVRPGPSRKWIAPGHPRSSPSGTWVIS